MLGLPFETLVCLLGELSERGNRVRSLWDHLFVMVEHSDKALDLLDCSRRSNLKDGFNFALLWLDSIGCEHKTEIYGLTLQNDDLAALTWRLFAAS